MEDVKWLLRKGGPFFVVLLIASIAGGLMYGQIDMKQDKVSEEVWEPPVEISSNEIEVIGTEEATDSSLWFLPQASECLISEEEKQQIKNMALQATEHISQTAAVHFCSVNEGHACIDAGTQCFFFIFQPGGLFSQIPGALTKGRDLCTVRQCDHMLHRDVSF